MFGIGKSKRDKLIEKARKLRQQAYDLSTSNRSLSGQKTAEAETIEKEIEQLDGK